MLVSTFDPAWLDRPAWRSRWVNQTATGMPSMTSAHSAHASTPGRQRGHTLATLGVNSMVVGASRPSPLHLASLRPVHPHGDLERVSATVVTASLRTDPG